MLPTERFTRRPTFTQPHEKILAEFSSGRTDDLNLDATGVRRLEKTRCIHVDLDLQTNVPHIYAIGGVSSRIAHSSVAVRDGQFFADIQFGGIDRRIWNYGAVVSTVFTNPELATCGMTGVRGLETVLRFCHLQDALSLHEAFLYQCQHVHAVQIDCLDSRRYSCRLSYGLP